MSFPSLASFWLSATNTQLIVGLPDTQLQFEASWERGGFARHFRSPSEWSMSLQEAIDTGLLSRPDQVWRIFDYFGRRRELNDLRAKGLRYVLGATHDDLANALAKPAALTKIWTHTRNTDTGLQFEFSDGFISEQNIANIIRAGQSEFLDFCACQAQRAVPALKRSSPDRFFITSKRNLSAFGWGLHTTLFMSEVVAVGGTFPSLWKSTLAALSHFVGRDLEEITDEFDD